MKRRVLINEQQLKNIVLNIIKEEQGPYGDFNGHMLALIRTFEEAHTYSDYANWNFTKDKNTFLKFIRNGGYFYFILKKEFASIPEEEGENTPLDEYGLSMIAVSFRKDGEINSVTSRWGHENGGNDNIMTSKQLSQLIGTDIYSVTKNTVYNNISYPKEWKFIKKVADRLMLFYDKSKNDYLVTDKFLEDVEYFHGRDAIVLNKQFDFGRDVVIDLTKEIKHDLRDSEHHTNNFKLVKNLKDGFKLLYDEQANDYLVTDKSNSLKKYFAGKDVIILHADKSYDVCATKNGLSFVSQSRTMRNAYIKDNILYIELGRVIVKFDAKTGKEIGHESITNF